MAEPQVNSIPFHSIPFLVRQSRPKDINKGLASRRDSKKLILLFGVPAWRLGKYNVWFFAAIDGQ